jgi:hypothetical protein
METHPEVMKTQPGAIVARHRAVNVLLSLTPAREIGFTNPNNISGGIMPSKPYAKMKVGKSCTCMMFIDS